MPRVIHHTATSTCLAFFLKSLFAFFVIVCTTVFAAENRPQPQEELEAVNAAIGEIQTWLQTARANYSATETNLQNAELEITDASRQVAAVDTRLKQTQIEQADLQARMSNLELQKSQQNELLQQLVRAAYMRGDQSMLKLLLNQEDFEKSARLLHYYQIFSESQLQVLNDYQATLDEIGQVSTSLQESELQLAQQQTQLQNQLAELEQARQAKQIALTELQNNISTRNAELEQLQIDQAQLQNLVNEIQRAIEQLPAEAAQSPFTSTRGHLPHPVNGKLLLAFGSRYGDGNLQRQGITLAATEGTPVQAVHGGRVVFADWLRGSGLLVIVDHGDGYMSLYGNNEALSAQAGDWVNAGDIVATSGKSNDASVAGLYFEIRHRGIPENPAEWLEGIE